MFWQDDKKYPAWRQSYTYQVLWKLKSILQICWLLTINFAIKNVILSYTCRVLLLVKIGSTAHETHLCPEHNHCFKSTLDVHITLYLKDAKEMNLHTICFPAVGLASQAKGKKIRRCYFVRPNVFADPQYKFWRLWA